MIVLTIVLKLGLARWAICDRADLGLEPGRVDEKIG